MYQPYLERVVAYAHTERFREEVALARKEFFARTGGEVFEDDRSVESRLEGFADWYLFDRPLAACGVPPTQAFLDEKCRELHPTELPVFRGFTETVRGLFEVRRLPKASRLRVRELCANREYEVLERRTLTGLTKGDLFEARLIPFQGELLFSAAFCHHPRIARKAILALVKARRKAGTLDPKAFLDDLLGMALKYERYRNVAIEAIYSSPR